MKSRQYITLAIAAALAMGVSSFIAQADDHGSVLEKSKKHTPLPPWNDGDEKGMANTQGYGTYLRCAAHLTNPDSKTYEISHIRSNTMPMSPFGAPLKYEFRPTASVPYSKHAFNGEHVLSGEPGAQGTQMDALGHFAVLPELWKGEGDVDASKAKYYNGYTQDQVKPDPASPLLKLGIDKVPPIVTSAVLLDAKAHLGNGNVMKDGALITAKDINDMLEKQGLGTRGLLPGDVLYIYTGWSDHWEDPDTKKQYYYMGPGLAADTMKLLEEKRIVLVALDNPFTDPVAKGMLQGKAPPAKGTPEGFPFYIHHYNLTQSGIHNIQNANLAALAKDKVWTSCTMILPLRTKGGSGSPVRPVAIGAPHK